MSHSQLRRLGTALVPAVLALSTFGVGAAYASGGLGSGGGGAGSGGGGGGGGGVTTTTAPSAPASCAQITAFSNSTGYYKAWAAIWTPFSVSSSCGTPVNWQMTYTNGTTGIVDFARSSSTQYQSGGTIDEDWAAFSTDYTVELTVTGTSGAVLASRSAVVTTKVPKTPGA